MPKWIQFHGNTLHNPVQIQWAKFKSQKSHHAYVIGSLRHSGSSVGLICKYIPINMQWHFMICILFDHSLIKPILSYSIYVILFKPKSLYSISDVWRSLFVWVIGYSECNLNTGCIRYLKCALGIRINLFEIWWFRVLVFWSYLPPYRFGLACRNISNPFH